MAKRFPLLLVTAVLALTALAGCTGSFPDEKDDGAESGSGDGDDHAGHGHGDSGASEEVTHPSIVGVEPYDGPTDADGVAGLCEPVEGDDTRVLCEMEALRAMLRGLGSEAAFDALDGLTEIDRDVFSEAHNLAHELGRYSYDAYGAIARALEHCSYKVFAGCFHGALQAYFTALESVDQSTVVGLCPSDNLFRQYTCLHGVGHGLMLHNHNAMNESLDLCDGLDTAFARESCQGGIFMENIVGYLDFARGTAHQHDGHGPLHYWVDEEDLYYPCDMVSVDRKLSCWMIQTTLILYFIDGDFEQAAALCEAEPDGFADVCFRSLGRDAASYSGRRLSSAVAWCSYATTDTWAGFCIAGYVQESILHYVDPEVGLGICEDVPDRLKQACYLQLGVEARNLVDPETLADLCSRSEEAYRGTCQSGAGIAVA